MSGGCDAVFRYFHIGGRRAIERRGKVLFGASLHGAEAESAGPSVFTVDTVDRSKLRGIVEAPASGGGVTDHVERSYDSGAFEIFGVECHVGRIESKAIFAGFYDFPLVVGVGGEYHRVVSHPVLGYLAVGRCRTIEGRGEIFCNASLHRAFFEDAFPSHRGFLCQWQSRWRRRGSIRRRGLAYHVERGQKLGGIVEEFGVRMSCRRC